MCKTSAHPMTILSLALIFSLTHISICSGVSVMDLNSVKNSEIDAMVRARGGGVVCNQKIGKCLTEVEEEIMDSETSRRILAMQKRYISYETLKRDMIPCATAGAPYYNCHAGAPNPYNRGCEVITRCARGISKNINH